MGKPYAEELDQFERTLKLGTELPLDGAADVLTSTSTARLICLGSGGSFTAAEFAARVSEDIYGRATTALTPLEYLQRAPKLGPHDVLLLSAEGKNSDARMAATAALAFARSVSTVTFRHHSPLLDILKESQRTNVLAIEAPWDKDGYLATNSLIATIVLLSRLVGCSVDVDAAAAALKHSRARLRRSTAVAAIAGGTQVIAVHGTVGAVAAVDLESKFAEAALGHVQYVDFRQFAHGRHIQLTEGAAPAVMVAFVSPQELDLWAAMRAELPTSIPTLTFALSPGTADGPLIGLLHAMALVEAVGQALGRDPGAPPVADFARRLHAMQAAQYLPESAQGADQASNPKIASLRRTGLSWATIEQAIDGFIGRLASAPVRALVLDFDGTCCETPLRLQGMDERIAQELQRLLDAGLVVAFASGRGDSLYEDLRQRLRPDTWPRVLLGCHSGSTLVRLSDAWSERSANPEFEQLRNELAELGVDKAAGFRLRVKAEQFTIECAATLLTMQAYLAAREVAQRRAGWRVFRSSHSVDILSDRAGKQLVLQRLTQELGVQPDEALLCIGDRGEVHGNDCELLAHALSLSVDGVSVDPNTCWSFGRPGEAACEQALKYLGALIPSEPGVCRVDPARLQAWRDQAVADVAQLRSKQA